MKLLSLLFTLALSLSALNASAFEQEAQSRATTVKLSSEKPLVVGNNTIVFQVFRDGKATSGDTVTIKSFMPAMPGMPYMDFKEAAKELGDGRYESVVNFSMSGTWQIHIFITSSDGKKYRVKTSINL